MIIAPYRTVIQSSLPNLLPPSSTITKYRDRVELNIIKKWYAPVTKKTATVIDKQKITYKYLVNTKEEDLQGQIDSIASLRVYKLFNDRYYTNGIYTGLPTSLLTEGEVLEALQGLSTIIVNSKHITIATKTISKREFNKFPGVIARENSITLREGEAYNAI